MKQAVCKSICVTSLSLYDLVHVTSRLLHRDPIFRTDSPGGSAPTIIALGRIGLDVRPTKCQVLFAERSREWPVKYFKEAITDCSVGWTYFKGRRVGFNRRTQHIFERQKATHARLGLMSLKTETSRGSCRHNWERVQRVQCVQQQCVQANRISFRRLPSLGGALL